MPVFLKEEDDSGGGVLGEEDGSDGGGARGGEESEVRRLGGASAARCVGRGGSKFVDSELDVWLYKDETLDGQVFVNGRQEPLGPQSAGPRVGSVLGSWRPWCPPEFIRKFRQEFPNGIAAANAGGALQYADTHDMLADLGQESLQTLVDSGFVFSDLAGSEMLAAEGADDEEEEEEEDVPRRRGRGRGGGRGLGRGGGGRGREEEEKSRGRRGGRGRKLKGRSRQSAYAPD